MIKELNDALNSFDISLDAVKIKLTKIGKEGYTKLFNSTKMPPVHYNHCYFAMASLKLKDVKNVLEIGTGPGRSTAILARLFPDAMIYTLDVPSSDLTFPKSWRGRAPCPEFARNTSIKNVKFIESNSFFIPSLNLPKQFEFIFVDGDHAYPAVAWDVMFSYNRLAKKGFMFMHDYEVTTKTVNHVNKTIEYMKSRIKEKVHLLPEYADPKWKNGKMACLIKD